jgi:soluble lytic murein transglycosylase-like protein
MIRFEPVPVLICLLALGLFGLYDTSLTVRAQGLKITDADVNLSNLDVSPEAADKARESVSGTGGGSKRGLAAERRVVGVNGALPLVVARQGGGSRQKLIAFTGYSKNRLEEAVYREAARYNIDPLLIFALIEQESGGRLGAVSPVGARGPMQLMPATAARFGVRNPHDPDEAVRGGVAYIVWLLDRFQGDVSLALAGYNSGEGAVEAYLTGKRIILRGGKVINPRGIRTGGIPPYRETQDYVRLIAGRYRRLRSVSSKASRR